MCVGKQEYRMDTNTIPRKQENFPGQLFFPEAA